MHKSRIPAAGAINTHVLNKRDLLFVMIRKFFCLCRFQPQKTTFGINRILDYDNHCVKGPANCLPWLSVAARYEPPMHIYIIAETGRKHNAISFIVPAVTKLNHLIINLFSLKGNKKQSIAKKFMFWPS